MDGRSSMLKVDGAKDLFFFFFDHLQLCLAPMVPFQNIFTNSAVLIRYSKYCGTKAPLGQSFRTETQNIYILFWVIFRTTGIRFHLIGQVFLRKCPMSSSCILRSFQMLMWLTNLTYSQTLAAEHICSVNTYFKYEACIRNRNGTLNSSPHFTVMLVFI